MSQIIDTVVKCNVHCRHKRGQPRYRLWVNDQLFTERTWIWDDNHYLEETIPIYAVPGKYQLRYELVAGDQAELSANHWEVTHGPGRIDTQGNLEI